MNDSSVSLSALQAFATKLQATANNIANFITPEYKAERVVMTSGPAGGVLAAVTRDLTPGVTLPQEAGQPGEPQEMSNVNLANEMIDLMLTRTAYQANARALSITQETNGKVIDIIG
ncbi:MAG: hypothetical protein JRI95_06010 [Deltaproteobacteria bacterium]|nr:hypothetical protein [Deltaproteobacteria bacterium]MBW2086146.1 hypothetical protein [Deltaproteobacteria bacterium]